MEETDEQGRKCRTTRNKDMGRGTPQGAPISPLLSNLYMRRFILGWKALGHEQRFQAKIVNYADDLVICCRRNAEQAMDAMRSIFRKLKLTVNEEKTHVCQVPRRIVRLSGLHVWVAATRRRTGNSYVEPTSLEEEDSGGLSPDQRSDQPTMVLAGYRGASGPTQPDHGRVGKLLLPRTRE